MNDSDGALEIDETVDDSNEPLNGNDNRNQFVKSEKDEVDDAVDETFLTTGDSNEFVKSEKDEIDDAVDETFLTTGDSNEFVKSEKDEVDDVEDETFLTTGDSNESIKSETLDGWQECLEKDETNDSFTVRKRKHSNFWHTPESPPKNRVDFHKVFPSTSEFSEEDAKILGKRKALSDFYESDDASTSEHDAVEHDYNTKIGNEVLEKVKFKKTRNCYCLLRCPVCRTCVHRFKGSLIDYSFPFHVCRHIRVVPHTYLGESVEVKGDCLKVIVSTDAETGKQQVVNLPIVNQSVKSKAENLETRKADLTAKFLGLLNTVNDYKHFEYFEHEANKLDIIHQLFSY